ncbi:hypothetical protein KRP22_007808 [Phytophthora ramorum]|nr:hypothetical protein KRP22_4180 [Phytophthora ramorum]
MNLHHERLAWNRDVHATGMPIYNSTINADESLEYVSDDFLSLFEQPKFSYLLTKKRLDKGGRGFPYSRSKTRWRKRPNDEIKFLKDEIVEMEKLIAALSVSATSREPKKKDRGPESSSQIEALRKLCDSHNRELQAALTENRKLRAQVSVQFQVVEALQRAVDDHARRKARKICWINSEAPSDRMFFALLDEDKE